MRTIIQIVAIPMTARSKLELFALCDDGSVWSRTPNHEWTRVKEIPQDEPKK